MPYFSASYGAEGAREAEKGVGSKIAHDIGFSQCAFKHAGVQGCKKMVWSAKFGVRLLRGEKFWAEKSARQELRPPKFSPIEFGAH